jgi:predicted RNA-binding protein with PIN domain
MRLVMGDVVMGEMVMGASDGGSLIVVDGNNVMGATPDGWWRDRPAAVRRLLVRLQCLHRQTTAGIVLVLDVPQPDLPEGDHDGVTIRYARRTGSDAADDRIVELLDEDPAPAGVHVEVVTSDRGLAERAVPRGATVTGARTFLTRLTDAGC